MPNPLWRTLSQNLFPKTTKVSREEILDLHDELSTQYQDYQDILEYNRPRLKKTSDQLDTTDMKFKELTEKAHKISESLKKVSPGSQQAEKLQAQLVRVQERIASIPLDANQAHAALSKTIATFPENTQAAIKLQKLLKDYVSAYNGENQAQVKGLFSRIPQVDRIDSSSYEGKKYGFEKNLKALLDGCQKIMNLTPSDELKAENPRESSSSASTNSDSGKSEKSHRARPD